MKHACLAFKFANDGPSINDFQKPWFLMDHGKKVLLLSTAILLAIAFNSCMLVTISLSFSYPFFNMGFLLTQLDVEDGHTLHLVVRQPDLPPPGSLFNHSGMM